MTNDTKEWVTIGIPEETRDKARERPETYEEIMQAGMKALANGESGPPALDEMQELDTEEITTRLKEELQTDKPTLEYDDVKQACKVAIRDELPTERM